MLPMPNVFYSLKMAVYIMKFIVGGTTIRVSKRIADSLAMLHESGD